MREIRVRSRGFTLIELLVVMAILSVLAAVVVPAVTGSTTQSRVTSESEDLNQVQNSVGRFNNEDTDSKPWPTLASLAGASKSWQAGELPTGSGPTGSGTSSDPYVFTQNDIAGIDWASQATVSGTTKVFVPDYQRNKPKHAESTDTISVAPGESSATFRTRKASKDVYVKLTNASSTTAVAFSMWGADKEGGVWAFVDATLY